MLRFFSFFLAVTITLQSARASKTLTTSFTSSLISKLSESTSAFPSLAAVTASSDSSSDSDTEATNAILKVVVSVQAGNDQTFSQVLVDTGSAVLWVGGQQAYQPGPNTVSGNVTSFSIGYGAGGASGPAYYDKVTIGDAIVNSQIIGAANSTNGFTLVSPIDGILGLGPSGSNSGEIIGFNSTPTFVESLVSEGSIDEPVFGIYVSGLDSTTGLEITEGEITFGGVDESKIDSDITWIPQNDPINFHWEFNISGMSWGTQQLVNTTMPARTDTGVLPIGLPFDCFFDIIKSFPGASLMESGTFNGFLTFPTNATTDSLPSLTYTIGGEEFTITPDKYLIPQGLYSSLNLTSGDAMYSWIASAGTGQFSLGQKWLESFYTVYDTQNHQVGIARLAQ